MLDVRGFQNQPWASLPRNTWSPVDTHWRPMREAKNQGPPSFTFTFLFPWACGCRADFKLKRQESLLWFDFSFPIPPPTPIHRDSRICLPLVSVKHPRESVG